MQRWKYKTVYRSREWESQGGVQHSLNSWDLDIEEILSALGEEGWELVSINSEVSSP
jgi:hypothetical protein